MGENDRSDIAVLKDISEKGNVHEIEVMAEATGDEAEQEHSSNLDEYNLSIDIPIEGRPCTKHSYNFLVRDLVTLV